MPKKEEKDPNDTSVVIDSRETALEASKSASSPVKELLDWLIDQAAPAKAAAKK